MSVGALLQAAIMVGRRRAAAGEPDAGRCRASGDSPAPVWMMLPAERRAATVALLAAQAARPGRRRA